MYAWEVVAGKREIANIVLPKSSSVGDLDAEQLQIALGLDSELLLDYEERIEEPEPESDDEIVAEAGVDPDAESDAEAELTGASA